MHWRRKWQPTPVFLPGESQGRGSLVGCRLWGRTESGRLKGFSSSPSSMIIYFFFTLIFLLIFALCIFVSIKKTERRGIDAFELWCWRRLLRVPWTARRSNQSILKEISPGCSLEELMKLKLQYVGHLMRRANSLEKTLMLGKIEGRRRRG